MIFANCVNKSKSEKVPGDMHNNPEGKDGLASSSKTTEVDIVGSAEDGMILAEKNQASDNESSQVPHMNEPELAKELQ